MKGILLLCLVMCDPPLYSQSANPVVSEPAQLAHISSAFSFTVNASLREAAPLFGPEGERVWAGDEWNPQFIFPSPPRDIEGAVFIVQHGEYTAVWVNTIFDLEAGRMQYVYVLADLLVTTIDVHLHPLDAQHTKINVTYARTALGPEANEHVAAMSQHDRNQGPEWESKINAYLFHRNVTPARP
jgi:hypothetical protein